MTRSGVAAPRLAAVVVSAGLLGGTAGCGGSGPTSGTQSKPNVSAIAIWDTKTQQLCREKRGAIAALGSVDITYGGIARLGLPAVKRLLGGYLDRLLTVLRRFAARQRQLATPASVASIMTEVRAVDDQSQAATVRLRTAVAHVTTAAGLSAVFRAWLVTLQHLAARGEALAVQLNLPACQSGSAGPRS